MKTEKAKRVAKRIVASILDKGLAESTWRSDNGYAYNALLLYRKDLEHDVQIVLERVKHDE